MRKVSQPQRGATIAIVSPSWGGPGSFPSVYNLALENLRSQFGFKIKEYPTTTTDAAHNHAHPEERARDLVAAFNDPVVDGIICSIGGDDSVRLLKYLDKYEFPPKFFMGYSDSTVLLNYFNQRGFYTFHGPAVMAGFAYYPGSNQEFVEHVASFLQEDWQTYIYKPYSTWTNKLLDWEHPEQSYESKSQSDNIGWNVLFDGNQKMIKGTLWGGCVEALEFIKGTKYWPGTGEFWKNKILMLEFSDDGTTETQMKWMIRNYGIQGAFDFIQALLIGRYANTTEEQANKITAMISNVVRGEFGSHIPIITNMDFGHTYPQQIFPIGTEATVMLIPGAVSISVETPFN